MAEPFDDTEKLPLVAPTTAVAAAAVGLLAASRLRSGRAMRAMRPRATSPITTRDSFMEDSGVVEEER